MNEYCCYEDLAELLRAGATGTFNAQHDDLLRDFCTNAARLIDSLTHRVFYPRSVTRYYDLPADDTWLPLDDDLLEVATFTTQNAATTVTAAQYYPMCGAGDYSTTPFDRLVLKADGSRTNLLYSGTVQKSQAVTGIWGYHEDWAAAWQNSNDTLAAAITSTSATTFTVADVDGADIYGVTPRFKYQQLLKVDSEYMYVTSKVAGTTNSLTVRRGVNGTTAATHVISSVVYVYRPMEEIERAALRLAANLYRQRDKFGDELTAMNELGQVGINRIVDNSIYPTIRKYTRRSVR